MTVIRKYAKAIVTFLIACAAGAVAQGLINGQSALWITVIIGALATAGVTITKNTPPPAV